MVDFDIKPNSNAYKSKQAEIEEKKKMGTVVKGTVKTKKKTELSKFASTFISEDAKDVKSYVFLDILVPTIKKVISDIVVDVTDMILYGKAGKSKGGGSKISYRSFYNSGSDRHDGPSARTRFDYDDLIFETRGDAEMVLEQLIDAIDRYKFVTVADYYDAANMTAPYTSNKYGWTSLRSAEVVRARDGYIIKLPKAMPID